MPIVERQIWNALQPPAPLPTCCRFGRHWGYFERSVSREHRSHGWTLKMGAGGSRDAGLQHCDVGGDRGRGNRTHRLLSGPGERAPRTVFEGRRHLAFQGCPPLRLRTLRPRNLRRRLAAVNLILRGKMHWVRWGYRPVCCRPYQKQWQSKNQARFSMSGQGTTRKPNTRLLPPPRRKEHSRLQSLSSRRSVAKFDVLLSISKRGSYAWNLNFA